MYTENYSLLPHNTFGIPCTADAFGDYSSPSELSSLLTSHPTAKLLHIGRGSNLLFLSERFCGMVLHNSISSIELVSQTADSVSVRVGGGCVWDDFVRHAISHGWHGAECLSLIPGEVGASAVQNIGAYGAEAAELIERVECMNLLTHEFRTFSHEECAFAYRHSLFKTPQHRGRWAVLYVTYRLQRHFSPKLSYGGLRSELNLRGISEHDLTPQQLRELVVDIRHAKLPDPTLLGNAGSFFKNPTVSQQLFQRLLASWPSMPHYPAPDGMEKIPAAWLIDQCGWRGRSLGPAAVHDRQALVLVNRGEASGADILALSQAICQSVSSRFGISLEPEVNFIS